MLSKDDPDKIVAARSGSPLLIGIGEDEFLVASDPAAVVANTKKVVYLNEGEIATLTPEGYSIYAQREPQEIEWDLKDVEKGDYPHFMLKEIMEQPESLRNSLRGRLLPDDGNAKLGGLMLVEDRLRDIEKLHIVACGTARHAGLVAELMLEEYAGVPTDVDAASEFRYRKNILEKLGSAGDFPIRRNGRHFGGDSRSQIKRNLNYRHYQCRGINPGAGNRCGRL